ncbi:MAG: hypothetical protein DRN20_00670 [Thermoplasmata archaeon]|nr:MAG: hypothetical protein DRN20_00670 [Thermoplasmata archaeon]
MAVRKSAYRRPVTAEGIKKIENKTLDYFDDAMWANLNTGVLEQYYNEKTRIEGFKRSKFIWKNVIIGIAIGTCFALINQYVGLKVGMIVSGAWYSVYLIGLAMRWGPTDVNIAAGASTGAAAACTGFVFSYPAIYLLALHKDYVIGVDAAGNPVHLVSTTAIPPIYIPMMAATLGGMLGVLYFTIFRRVWLIEDPLPVPGFEASVKLVDIANDISRGAIQQAKKSIINVAKWASAIAFFTFLRDFPLRNGESALDSAFGGRVYRHGEIAVPYYKYTHIGFELIPIQMAIGWFMRFRRALLINLGTLLTWFVIVPLTVHYHYPVYVPARSTFYDVATFSAPAIIAWKTVARVVAIGAILGGGITSLVKMWPVFRSAMSDVFVIARKAETERFDYVEGMGWFEWPMTQIPIMAIIAFLGIAVLFIIGGFPVPQTIVFALLLVVVTFFLGAIGVKVMGETGITPVSGTSFIVLIILILTFKAMGTDLSTLIIFALVGSTVFGTSLSLSSDIIGDFKIGVYAGTRPYHLVKGELTAIPFGAVVAATGATIFSIGLARGALNLQAPQAHAFATFAQIMLGPNPPYDLFLIGMAIGVLAELTTGMGTAFGLGMYLPLPLEIPLLVGGAFRDWWEKKVLEPRAKKEGWSERQKTLKVVSTYMAATGVIIGEALMGTVIAIYYVLPLIRGG